MNGEDMAQIVEFGLEIGEVGDLGITIAIADYNIQYGPIRVFSLEWGRSELLANGWPPFRALPGDLNAYVVLQARNDIPSVPGWLLSQPTKEESIRRWHFQRCGQF